MSSSLGDLFEDIGKPVGDRIDQFGENGATRQRLYIGLAVSADEVGEGGQLLEPHRHQPLAGQHETDRGRQRQVRARSIHQRRAQKDGLAARLQPARTLDFVELLLAWHREPDGAFDKRDFPGFRFHQIDPDRTGRRACGRQIGHPFARTEAVAVEGQHRSDPSARFALARRILLLSAGNGRNGRRECALSGCWRSAASR